MSMDNYPGGFKDGILIRGLPLHVTNPGKVFWVSNSTVQLTNQRSGSDGNDGTFNSPFATLDYAIGKCTINRGDVIMVKPGHAESITSATTLALDVAGVSIIGLGAGTARPTLTFTTANTATIAVSAANISIQNVKFVGNFLSIATVFTLTTAKYFSVTNCEFVDTSAILGFLSIVTTSSTANAADGLEFNGNYVKSDATTSPGPAIVIAGTTNQLDIISNEIIHTVASNNIAALLDHGALVVSAAMIAWNSVYSINTDTATGGLLVKTTATTGSGIIQHNRIRAQDIAAEIIVPVAAVQYGMFDNLYTGETTLASGFVSPAIGSTA